MRYFFCPNQDFASTLTLGARLDRNPALWEVAGMQHFPTLSAYHHLWNDILRIFLKVHIFCILVCRCIATLEEHGTIQDLLVLGQILCKKDAAKNFCWFLKFVFCGIEWGSSMVFAIGIGSNYFCQVSGSALQCSCKIPKISAFSDPHNKVIQAQLYFLFPLKNIHQSLMMIACKATGFLFLLLCCCWCVQANEIQTLLSGFRVVD